MIRHFQKNGNKKFDTSLCAKIIALLENHPRYLNDLYDACDVVNSPAMISAFRIREAWHDF